MRFPPPAEGVCRPLPPEQSSATILPKLRGSHAADSAASSEVHQVQGRIMVGALLVDSSSAAVVLPCWQAAWE